jgi:hypothetical protein
MDANLSTPGTPGPDRAPGASRGRVLLALAAFTALVVGASAVVALLVALARYVDRLV